jgi:hypothetical protein
VEDLILLLLKNYLPMHLVESPWLKHFGLQLCPKVIFAFQKKVSQEILLELVKKLSN